MQISNSKLCESSKCRVTVYSAVNHPWWMSMPFHLRDLLWLVSAVRYTMKEESIATGTQKFSTRTNEKRQKPS